LRDLIGGVDEIHAFSIFRVHPEVRCLGANSRGDLGITPAALADRYRRRPRLLVIPASLAIGGTGQRRL
jgi:hypothetical protein